MSSLSQEYYNLFTPAGYAFSIWGVIYLALLAFSVFQIYCAYSEKERNWHIEKTGPWFFLANLANAAWVIVWLYELTALSVLLMFFILFALIKVIINTNMERWNAPMKIIAFAWWPICLYAGWIAVAAIANVAAYLAKIDWDGWFFNEVQWTLLMIIVATIINIAMIYKRNMREFAIVGVWALVAIYFRHFEDLKVVSYTALLSAVAVFSNIVYHGWMNRKENPMYKMMNKE